MKRWILSLMSLFCFVSLYAQTSGVEFGKNRVQHHDFKWFEYHSENFTIYWYGTGRSVAHATVQLAEWDYQEIQNLMEHRINRRLEIIVYTDLTDLKQSNIGNEETFENTGGQTKIVENKIFVHFTGNHDELRQQIRGGIAGVYLNSMMYGSNFQEIVQNAILLNLPSWFEKGLMAYVSESWNTKKDNQLRDIFEREAYKSFEEFAEENPILAGHSLWYFISERYGASTVSNLLYLTRINRSVGSGFLYVLGTTYEGTLKEWNAYFSERYSGDEKLGNFPKEEKFLKYKNRRQIPISEVILSNDGSNVAYASNEIGKIKVFVQSITSGKRKTVHKVGFRNVIQATDYNYPLLAWSKDEEVLGIIYEHRDVIYLKEYNLATQESTETIIPNFYQRILSVEYLDSKNLLLTAMINGYSDVMIFNIPTRQTNRITEDFYDDAYATAFSFEGQQGVIWSSNRAKDSLLMPSKLDTILPLGKYDLYFYPLQSEDKIITRLTNTPLTSEIKAQQIDSTWFAYLSDDSGVFNRKHAYLENYIAYYQNVVMLTSGEELINMPDSLLAKIPKEEIDTAFARPIYRIKGKSHSATAYNRNLLEQHILPSTSLGVSLFYHDGKYKIMLDSIKGTASAKPLNTSYRQRLLNYNSDVLPENPNTEAPLPIPSPPSTSPKPKENFDFEFIVDYIPSTENSSVEDTASIDIDNYEFETPYDTPDSDSPVTVVMDKDDGTIKLERPTKSKEEISKSVHQFQPSKVLSHRRRFRAELVTTQLDNSLFFGGLEPYTGDPYQYPTPGITLSAKIQDLFEDFELYGGVRIPSRFNGTEYFLMIKDLRKRTDWHYSYYRRAVTDNNDDFIIPIAKKTVSNILQTQARYPLDIYTSLRGTAYFRNDQNYFLATNRATLEVPTISQQRLGIRGEFVFDNTLDISLNMKQGTRAKVYAEFVKRFEVNLVGEFDFNLTKKHITIVGLDARHYERLGKHAILAGRLAGATSFGPERMVYYLGGTDNMLFPFGSFNDNIPIPSTEEFAYQTIAPTLRGFDTNIRNGNSYMLANVELRANIFKYFYKRQIRSNFVKNFQIIGFFDVGTAWQGVSPFNDENPLNTVIIDDYSPVVTVEVNYFRDPIVAGYGVGARSTLFGYFIRFDYAWGVETGIVQPAKWHLSLGMDF